MLNKKIFLYTFFSIFLFLFLGWFALARWPQQQAIAPQELSYYRAVYVLQKLQPIVKVAPSQIPSRIRRHDSTENYLHHPDKQFILRTIAQELEQCITAYPEAPRFLAYVYYTLEEYEKSAELLTNYVVQGTYSPEDYQILCESVYFLQDWTTLYILCLEWEEKDPSCQIARFRYAWAALYNSQRYTDAKSYVTLHERCVGWEAPVYHAKALHAQGRTTEAEAVIANACANNPGNATKITLLWQRNKGLAYY